MNISSSTAPAATVQPTEQRPTEASEGMHAENDRDTDDRAQKAPAVTQLFISKPTATMGNHLNTVA